ncbi:uncharacterized protein BDR25DRAFT_307443 [Lindgomyces ingoldianus]|uniref:Uncharacterized protein n=1 Tax=Lindgomyces ingoldianus TaxID=673940 RepID=A0ACB6QAL1_9PLEO|nr:uncharacterized protein BDR25DRAFT_307443 [Lindgomyces ingoldianus]KAF2463968.1 hypothetical protein BDR25DRAFT_307443 [Lindgomyces ingoldianus]
MTRVWSKIRDRTDSHYQGVLWERSLRVASSASRLPAFGCRHSSCRVGELKPLMEKDSSQLLESLYQDDDAMRRVASIEIEEMDFDVGEEFSGRGKPTLRFLTREPKT